MEADNFQTTTEVFLSWLAKMGIQISPKIAVADLRTSGKNRGVGEFPLYTPYSESRIGSSREIKIPVIISLRLLLSFPSAHH